MLRLMHLFQKKMKQKQNSLSKRKVVLIILIIIILAVALLFILNNYDQVSDDGTEIAEDDSLIDNNSNVDSTSQIEDAIDDFLNS